MTPVPKVTTADAQGIFWEDMVVKERIEPAPVPLVASMHS
jgi:hypothetical protein